MGAGRASHMRPPRLRLRPVPCPCKYPSKGEIDGSSCHETQPQHMWRSVCRLAPRGALHQKEKANRLCHVCMAPISFSRVHTRLQNAKMNPAKQNKTKQNKTKQKPSSVEKEKKSCFGVGSTLRPTAVGTRPKHARPVRDPATCAPPPSRSIGVLGSTRRALCGMVSERTLQCRRRRLWTWATRRRPSAGQNE